VREILQNHSQKSVWFYHVMDLPGIGTVGLDQGWDLRGRFDEYIGHIDLKGKTFLDVGTASGFLSFEAEKRGASVTSFDAGSIEDREDRPSRNERSAQAAIDHWMTSELAQMHAGYELAHKAFNSSAKIARGSIYQLSKIVPQHEIVLVGQILVHLKDPFNALREAAACCSDTLVVVEGSFFSDEPIARFVGGTEVTGYWHISSGLYRRWLDKFGFDMISDSSSVYPCNHSKSAQEHTVWTFVAKKRTTDRPMVSYSATTKERRPPIGRWLTNLSLYRR
jgi:hypothetical protein